MRKLRRILLIVMVSFFPLLWAASHVWRVGAWRSEGVGLFGQNMVYLELHDGSFWCKVIPTNATSRTWQLDYGYDKPRDVWYATEREIYDHYCFLGFGYKPFDVDPSGLDDWLRTTAMSLIRVPFWFLSCLGFLLGWWFWRLNDARLRLTLLAILISFFPLLWAWSYVRWCGVQYADGVRVFTVAASGGSVYYTVGEGAVPSSWGIIYEYVSPEYSDYYAPYSFGGFGAKWYRVDPSSADPYARLHKFGLVRIPYWFLTCLVILLGGWIWRRRGRTKKAEGFSPEVKQVRSVIRK